MSIRITKKLKTYKNWMRDVWERLVHIEDTIISLRREYKNLAFKEKLLSEALEEFIDADAKRMEDHRRRLVHIEDKNNEILSYIKSNGFGVQSIIGFILQVYFILYYKQYPILFMDEAMTNLSKQYLPYFKSLINDLAERYGFIFVLVTHDSDIKELADRTYMVSKGVVTLYNEV